MSEALSFRNLAAYGALSAGLIANGCSAQDVSQEKSPTTPVEATVTAPPTVDGVCISGIKQAAIRSNTTTIPMREGATYEAIVQQSRGDLVTNIIGPLAGCVESINFDDAMEGAVKTDVGPLYRSKGDGSGRWWSVQFGVAGGDQVTLGWQQRRHDNSIGTIYASLTTPDPANPDSVTISNERQKADVTFTEYQHAYPMQGSSCGGSESGAPVECPPMVRRDDAHGLMHGERYSTLDGVDPNHKGLDKIDGAKKSQVAVDRIRKAIAS